MPARPFPSTLRQLAARLHAERWLVDRARQNPTARRLRAAVERCRVRALVRREGSIDAALDRIVVEAIAGDTGPDTAPGSQR